MLQIPFLYAFNICQMINKFFLFSGKIFKNRIVIQNRGKHMASLNLKLIINYNFYQLFKPLTLLKLFWCLSKTAVEYKASITNAILKYTVLVEFKIHATQH